MPVLGCRQRLIPFTRTSVPMRGVHLFEPIHGFRGRAARAKPVYPFVQVADVIALKPLPLPHRQRPYRTSRRENGEAYTTIGSCLGAIQQTRLYGANASHRVIPLVACARFQTFSRSPVHGSYALLCVGKRRQVPSCST